MLLAAEGSTVVVTDIQDEAGAAVVAEIEAAGGSASYLHHDVTSEDEWKAVATSVTEAHGRIDVLVNNAGIGIGGSVLDFELSDWPRQMAINVDGVFYLSRAFAQQLVYDGAIVNVSSTCGVVGAAGLAAYCTSKGALNQLTRTMALELADKQINVNAVAPGAIKAPMLFSGHATQAATDSVVQRNQSSIPIGDVAQPKEVARAVLFLATERHITGTILSVDGGYTAT